MRYINALLEPLECSALAQPGGKAYFDMKDGASAKDRVGLRFQTSAAAIEHGKHLARRLRGDPWIDDPDLYISIVDDAGQRFTGSKSTKDGIVNGPNT